MNEPPFTPPCDVWTRAQLVEQRAHRQYAFEAEAVNPLVDGSSPKMGISVPSGESGGATVL